MTSPDLDRPQHPLADLKDRVSAFLIDAAIFFVIVVCLTVTIVAIVEKQTSDDDYSLFVLAVVLFWTTVLVQVIWGGLLEGIWGLTPGKAALKLKRIPVKLKVVSADDHNQTIGFARGIAREIIRTIPIMTYFLFYIFSIENLGMLNTFLLVSVLVFVIDHLWPLWDKERQTLHDKIADSHVISKETKTMNKIYTVIRKIGLGSLV